MSDASVSTILNAFRTGRYRHFIDWTLSLISLTTWVWISDQGGGFFLSLSCNGLQYYLNAVQIHQHNLDNQGIFVTGFYLRFGWGTCLQTLLTCPLVWLFPNVCCDQGIGFLFGKDWFLIGKTARPLCLIMWIKVCKCLKCWSMFWEKIRTSFI